MKLTVVYPTFNEKESAERNLTLIYGNLRKEHLTPEILIVDDSNDGTDKILKACEKKYKTLRVIHREKGRGVGSAIRLGIQEARGEAVIISMFDVPQEVFHFPALLSKIEEGYDVVFASRFLEGNLRNYPFIKRIGNRLCNTTARILFLRPDLKDFTYLFKIFRKNVALDLNLESNEFDVGLEIATKAVRKGYKLTEIPVDSNDRDLGKSKFVLKRHALFYFKRLINVWLFYK